MAVRVLYIIDSLTLGGTERQLVELIRNMDRSRVEPHLCTLKESTDLYDELDIPKICLGYRSFSSPCLLGNLIELSKFIAKHRIQVIQTFFQDPFLLAALVKPFCRIPLVGSFRDLGFWRTSAQSCKMRIAYPFYAGFLANSQAVKEHFVCSDGIDPAKVEVICNGFDTSTLRKEAWHGGEDEIVGIVANLNRAVKRVEDFVKAVPLVRPLYPRARFLVIGGGDLQGGLEALAAELQVRECIDFTGRIADPLAYVSRFSVGVITSETEGFCNAIIEYMACGVPVVATDVGGNREMVAEGVNGFLVPVGDPGAVAAAVGRLLGDEELRRRMGESNRAKVAGEYSLQAMLERQASYYERVARL